MPVITCLAPEVKQDLVEILRESGASARELKQLEKVDSCETGMIGVKAGRARGGGRLTPSHGLPGVYEGVC